MIKRLIRFFERNKAISIILLIIILGIMFYCSNIPGSSVHFGTVYPSVLYHFSIFFGFAFFLLAIINDKKKSRSQILLAILVSLIVSILDELHQAFVPLRDPSIKDVLTDLTGSIVSVFLCYLFNRD